MFYFLNLRKQILLTFKFMTLQTVANLDVCFFFILVIEEADVLYICKKIYVKKKNSFLAMQVLEI